MISGCFDCVICIKGKTMQSSMESVLILVGVIVGKLVVAVSTPGGGSQAIRPMNM